MLQTTPTASERTSLAHSEDYPAFDSLRFVLASIVALGHAKVITWDRAGSLAVQVFFAMSGWLIGGILLRSGTKDLPRFFFNRATRIWIPYFTAALVLYILSAFRDPVTTRWVEFLFYDVTFTHNWFSLRPEAMSALAEMPLQGTGNHFWSIATEEQFYLIAPLLMVALPFGRSPTFWFAAVPLLWLVNYDFATIGLGVLAVSAAIRYGHWHTTRSAIAALSLLACCTGVAMAMGQRYDLLAPPFAIAVVLLAARPGARSTIGQFFGGISYPMYLNHWIGAFVAHGINKRLELVGSFVEGVCAYGLGVLAGAVAYLLIDRAVLAKRSLYYTPQAGLILGTAAYAIVSIGLLFGLWRWNIFP